VIVAIGGLPGVGKTTVARELARRMRAAHVRIDALESALVATGLVANPAELGPEGYGLALAVADTCLAAGGDVVVDAVFPIAISRQPFSELAERRAVPIHWIRLVCSDTAEHRRRVENRVFDLPGAGRPDWAAVTGRETDEWTEPHAVVDTAAGDAVTTVQELLATEKIYREGSAEV
jgi:predicted kinase